MKNALSFDVEEWYQAETLRQSGISYDPVSQVLEATTQLLDLLKRYQVQATFFVVGETANRFPRLIERLLNDGHELGLHGWTHEALWRLDPHSLRGEIEAFLNWRDQHFQGVPVYGFRAPTFSLDQSTAWAVPILQDYFQYDSSIFPAQTPLYGVPTAPTQPYFIRPDDVSQPSDTGLLEIPMSVFPFFGQNIGFTGGLYLRVFPLSLVKYMIRHRNKRQISIMTYIHPWELYPQTPRLMLSPWQRFVLYSGLPVTSKLENLLQTFEFDSIHRLYLKP